MHVDVMTHVLCLLEQSKKLLLDIIIGFSVNNKYTGRADSLDMLDKLLFFSFSTTVIRLLVLRYCSFCVLSGLVNASE